MLGSYYESNYYRNPGPVYGPWGDKMEPVPGWGPLPNMAGPARVGIGQNNVMKKVPTEGYRLSPRDPDRPAVPSYVWLLAAAFTVGGAAAYAHKRGWLRKVWKR